MFGRFGRHLSAPGGLCGEVFEALPFQSLNKVRQYQTSVAKQPDTGYRKILSARPVSEPGVGCGTLENLPWMWYVGKFALSGGMWYVGKSALSGVLGWGF